MARKIMTVRYVGSEVYQMVEDVTEHDGDGWFWTENCIAGLAYEK